MKHSSNDPGQIAREASAKHLRIEELLRRDAIDFPPAPMPGAFERLQKRLESHPRAARPSVRSMRLLAVAAVLVLVSALAFQSQRASSSPAADQSSSIAAALPRLGRQVRAILSDGGNWTIGFLDDELELFFGRELTALRSDAGRAADSVLGTVREPWNLLSRNSD